MNVNESSDSEILSILDTVVSAFDGQTRRGQQLMTLAIEQALQNRTHVAVQAGTGTGKSLAYLIPAIVHALNVDEPIVVATATIALQRQLVDRDLPALIDAITPVVDRRPSFAILKGRNNYACHLKVHGGPGAEDEPELIERRSLSVSEAEHARVVAWFEETETGDRSELRPGVSDRVWSANSSSAMECIGAAACSFGKDCFSEKARAAAGEVDVVVTNHALLAINASRGGTVLPEHSAIIIDEAHELTDRVTGVQTMQLSVSLIDSAATRCRKMVDEQIYEDLRTASENFDRFLRQLQPGRWDSPPADCDVILTMVKDATSTAQKHVESSVMSTNPEASAARQLASSSLEDISSCITRVLESLAAPLTERTDIVWLTSDDRSPAMLYVAPLSVAGLLRSAVFEKTTTILTSATLSTAGSLENIAIPWGLPPLKEAQKLPTPKLPAEFELSDDDAELHSIKWDALDVGSPFDYGKAGILYCAAHLPPPGKPGESSAQLTELAELITAAGGRTLALFSSMRAGVEAAEYLRENIDTPVLCQGDDTTGTLVEEFADDEATTLCGTLSLWQGVDVPGPSLTLVTIDRIPFPRPDDPLLSARQRAIDMSGGNGFMAVAASHAALLLAQGAGRLIRSSTDKGVVAVLDSRLAHARYGSFLTASMPAMWLTTDGSVVRQALSRLS